MIDKSKIESLPLDVQKEKAFNKILRYACASEQSSLKVRKKLEAQGFCVEAVDFAISKALDLRIIDDKRYSECLIRSTLFSGKGLRFIKQEIEDLGVDLNSLESYTEYIEQDEEEEVERAYLFLCSHPTKAKNVYQACFKKLINKGFEGDVVHRAVKRYLDSTSM